MSSAARGKQIGLFFGSFNPVHIGHLIIASYVREFTDLDEVWLVVSPHNPFKEKKTLLNDNQRLMMARLAVEDDPHLKVSDIEFKLSQPSYTINTLTHLQEKYPHYRFHLIMGTDNLESFPKWKNSEEILKQSRLYVFPRPGYSGGVLAGHPSVRMVNAPHMEISSTFIRSAIKDGKDVRYMLPEKVFRYVDEMKFYKK